jgi:hypothetical protein
MSRVDQRPPCNHHHTRIDAEVGVGCAMCSEPLTQEDNGFDFCKDCRAPADGS